MLTFEDLKSEMYIKIGKHRILYLDHMAMINDSTNNSEQKPSKNTK